MQILRQGLYLLENLGCTPHVFAIMHCIPLIGKAVMILDS